MVLRGNSGAHRGACAGHALDLELAANSANSLLHSEHAQARGGARRQAHPVVAHAEHDAAGLELEPHLDLARAGMPGDVGERLLQHAEERGAGRLGQRDALWDVDAARKGRALLADKAGQEIGVSSWIEVGQQRIDEFAHCTEDRQWIHVDVERAAKESPAGGTIAHGYLVLALLAPTGMEILVPRVRAKQILNYGLDKVRFPAPVLAGKRVRNRIKLAAAEDKGGGRWLLSLENTVEIEGGDKPALVATTLAMVFG